MQADFSQTCPLSLSLCCARFISLTCTTHILYFESCNNRDKPQGRRLCGEASSYLLPCEMDTKQKLTASLNKSTGRSIHSCVPQSHTPHKVARRATYLCDRETHHNYLPLLLAPTTRKLSNAAYALHSIRLNRVHFQSSIRSLTDSKHKRANALSIRLCGENAFASPINIALTVRRRPARRAPD